MEILKKYLVVMCIYHHFLDDGYVVLCVCKKYSDNDSLPFYSNAASAKDKLLLF